MIAFGSHLALLLLSEILVPFCAMSVSGILSMIAAVINCLIGIFFVIWFIIGNYWYWSLQEGQCDNNFYYGYYLVNVLLIFHYIMLGLGLCLGCILVILISIGSGLTTKANHYS